MILQRCLIALQFKFLNSSFTKLKSRIIQRAQFSKPLNEPLLFSACHAHIPNDAHKLSSSPYEAQGKTIALFGVIWMPNQPTTNRTSMLHAHHIMWSLKWFADRSMRSWVFLSLSHSSIRVCDDLHLKPRTSFREKLFGSVGRRIANVFMAVWLWLNYQQPRHRLALFMHGLEIPMDHSLEFQSNRVIEPSA